MENRIRIWQWIFLLFVAALPFQTVYQIPVSNTAVQVSDVLLALAGVAWLIGRGKNFRWATLHSLLTFFVFSMLLSAVFSSDPATSYVKFMGKLLLAAIAFLTFSFVREPGGLQLFIRAWTLTAVVIAALGAVGIAVFFLGLRDPAINLVVHPIFGSLPAGNYPRIEGFFKYPAILSNYLSVSWWLAIAGVTALWINSRRSILLFPLLLITNLFTLTPGLGGFFFSNGIFLLNISDDKIALRRVAGIALLAASGVMLFVSVLVLFEYSSDGPRIPLRDGQIRPSHRVAAWTSGLETFQKYPILGNGIGVPSSYAIYVDGGGNRHLLADAHNTYINVLAESGIVGFLALVAIAGWLISRLITLTELDVTGNVIRTCLILALADAFFFQSVTGSYEDQRHIWVLFGLIAGFCSTSIEMPEKRVDI